MRISVFDMRQLYQEWNIRPGDYLLAETENWLKGSFTLSSVVQAGSITEKARQEWASALDTGFESVFSKPPWPLPPDEELARAFFHAGTGIIQEPSLHLGGYIDESSIVGFVEIEGSSYLWKRGEEIDDQTCQWAGSL